MTESNPPASPDNARPRAKALVQWDERYNSPDYIFGTAANAYLQSQAWRLPATGRALAVADGEGRNGVWLAQAGLDVLSIDGSPVGLAKAQALATARGVKIQTVCADLTQWDWPTDAFDVVVSIFLHMPPADRRQTHARILRALRPGGLFILEAYHTTQLGLPSGGPSDITLLYDLPSLREDFAPLQILEALEGTTHLTEGPRHQGQARIVRFTARKS